MKSSGSVPAGTARLYSLCALLALGSSIWGFDIGIWSSILVHPGWRRAMRSPDASDRGALTAVYYLGTLLSYLLFSHPLADRLGRRYAAMCGTVVLSIGAVVMAAAGDVGVMALGRWLCGIGVAITSTTVPLYQSEVSPAPERGKFVTMNHVGFIAGLATGLWVGYGMTFWTGPSGEFWGWRVTILLQLVPAIIFAIGLPFLPETPRWLVEKGHTERARRVLHWLRQDTKYHSSVTHELHAITTDVDARPYSAEQGEGQGTYAAITRSLAVSISLVRQPSLRARLWRAFLLQFLAQMCGAAAMKYYLPSLLEALGVNTRLALMAGAIEMTIKIGMTVVEMWIIDRVGRKTCLIGGSCLMAVAMLINGALPLAYPKNQNKAADIACIIFIFLYAVGYSLGLGPAAWVYSSEIFPTSVRARGLNFAASGGSIGSILVSHIWPLGLAKWGSGVYFFFMIVNLVCGPIIWFFYPETKGRPLEDMDSLFGKTSFSGGGRGASLMLSDSVEGDEEEAGQDGHREHEQDAVPPGAAAADIHDDEEHARLLSR